MKVFIVQLTESCNQDCIYCCRAISNTDEATEKIIAKIEAADSSTEKIIITGGEPSLHPYLGKVVKAAARKAKTVHVQTNGMLFSDIELCRRIISAGANSFLVSFPTFESRTFSEISGAGALDKKLHGLRNLSMFRNAELGVVFVPVSLNYRELPKYVANLSKISRDIYLQLSYPVRFRNYLEKKEVFVTYRELSPYLEKALVGLAALNMEHRIDGFPLCLLPGQAQNISDLKTHKHMYTDDFIKSKRRAYDSDNYPGKERVMARVCRKCKKNECKGLYEHYAGLFGTDELQPFLSQTL